MSVDLFGSVPLEGEGITLCELESRLLSLDGSSNDFETLERYKAGGGVAFPNVLVPNNTSATHNLSSVASVSLLDTSTVFAHSKQPAVDTAPIFHTAPSLLARVWESFSAFALRRLGFSHVRSTPAAVERREQHGGSPVIAMDWNAVMPVFAVALRTDAVFFFDLQRERWEDGVILTHELQREVLALRWRPDGGPNDLAVATASGVLLWTMQGVGLEVTMTSAAQNGMSSRFSGAWGRMLCDHEDAASVGPFSAMAWSPDGSYVAAGRERSLCVCVWDVSTSTRVALCEGGGGAEIAWSPDGAQLVTCGTRAAGCFAVWNTSDWTATKFLVPGQSPGIRHVCWHASSSAVSGESSGLESDATFLVFAEGDRNFHSFTMRPDLERPSEIADLKPVYSGTYSLPKNASCVAWSPCGMRFVIGFKGHPVVAVLETTRSRDASMYFLGYVRGAPEFGQAEVVEFKPIYKKGALLTVVWTSGKISFVPLLF